MELAMLSKTYQNTISLYERFHFERHDPIIMKKIADVFEVPVKIFFTDEEWIGDV